MYNLTYFVELIGVISFGISGILLAKQKEMDPLGIFALAFVTAFGGGTLRDIVLDIHPAYWIRNDEMTIVIFAMSVLLSYIKTPKFINEKLIFIPDSIGLALFSIAGTEASLSQGNGGFVSCLLGLCSGVAGGALRDVLANEIPYIFQKRYLYASCSFFGCWVYVMCEKVIGIKLWDTIIALFIIAVMRIVAAKYKITLFGRET